MPRSARRRARWAGPTYGAAGLVFAGALGGIVAQVRAGEDPALGAVRTAAIPAPHYVITRRVERRRIVVRRVRDLPPITPRPVAAAPAAPAAVGVPAAAPAPYVAPRAAASAAAAPSRTSSSSSSSSAPAAAPAPAPAVSAPVTRAS